MYQINCAEASVLSQSVGGGWSENNDSKAGMRQEIYQGEGLKISFQRIISHLQTFL